MRRPGEVGYRDIERLDVLRSARRTDHYRWLAAMFPALPITCGMVKRSSMRAMGAVLSAIPAVAWHDMRSRHDFRRGAGSPPRAGAAALRAVAAPGGDDRFIVGDAHQRTSTVTNARWCGAASPTYAVSPTRPRPRMVFSSRARERLYISWVGKPSELTGRAGEQRGSGSSARVPHRDCGMPW